MKPKKISYVTAAVVGVTTLIQLTSYILSMSAIGFPGIYCAIVALGLALCVTLWTRKHRIAACYTMVARAGIELYFTAKCAYRLLFGSAESMLGYSWSLFAQNLFRFLSWAMLAALLVLQFAASERRQAIVRKLWVVPGVFSVLSVLFNCIESFSYAASTSVLSVVLNAFTVASMVFLGKWVTSRSVEEI